jgi:hypothetical protein
MSEHPLGDTPFGYASTGVVALTPLRIVLQRSGSKRSPHTYARGSSSPVASTHSSSVGRTPPAHSANANASKKSTPTTGWSARLFGHAPFGQYRGGRCPVSATKRAYRAFVTGVRST